MGVIRWDSNVEYLDWNRTSVMVFLPLVRRIDGIPLAVLACEFPLARAASDDQGVLVLLVGERFDVCGENDIIYGFGENVSFSDSRRFCSTLSSLLAGWALIKSTRLPFQQRHFADVRGEL